MGIVASKATPLLHRRVNDGSGVKFLHHFGMTSQAKLRHLFAK